MSSMSAGPSSQATDGRSSRSSFSLLSADGALERPYGCPAKLPCFAKKALTLLVINFSFRFPTLFSLSFLLSS